MLANNGYAERFGFFRGKLLHVFTYASMTEAFDPARLGGQRGWAATPASPMGTTLRRISGRGGDRLLVRSRYTYNPSLRVGEGTLRRAGARHDGKLAHRFPSLAGLRMEYRWGGAMALTWNGVPAFGEVEAGVLAACGCNGLGASNATASGLAAAETLARRRVRADPDLPRLRQPAGAAAAAADADRRQGDARPARMEGRRRIAAGLKPRRPLAPRRHRRELRRKSTRPRSRRSAPTARSTARPSPRSSKSLIAAGVHGIIIAGSTGEYYAHTPQERFDVAAYAKQVIGTACR